jgi:hypothetical protein
VEGADVAPVVIAHAVATWFLVGMIWTIQVVHYPLFAQVGADRFAAYEAAHSLRITTVIALPWAVQGLTTLGLLIAPPAGVDRWLVWTIAVLAALPVIVTITLSVPAHEVLGRGFDAAAHARLVSTNWLRTAAWSAHAGLAVVLLAQSQRGR